MVTAVVPVATPLSTHCSIEVAQLSPGRCGLIGNSPQSGVALSDQGGHLQCSSISITTDRVRSLLSPGDSEFPRRPSSVVVQSVVRDLTKNLVLLSTRPTRFRRINYWINSRNYALNVEIVRLVRDYGFKYSA